MTANGWFQIGLYLLVIFLVTKPIGVFMTRVFNREKTFLDPLLRPIEKLVYRLTWRRRKTRDALDGIRGGHASVQRRFDGSPVSHRAHAEMAAAQSAEISQRRAGLGFRHGGIVHHQHELAGLHAANPR